jgi:hypothetical protein
MWSLAVCVANIDRLAVGLGVGGDRAQDGVGMRSMCQRPLGARVPVTLRRFL